MKCQKNLDTFNAFIDVLQSPTHAVFQSYNQICHSQQILMSAVKLLMTVTLMLPVLTTLEATAVSVWLALTEVASTVQVNSKINTILS